jgi:cytochrome c-type biogenesis protein CcsB
VDVNTTLAQWSNNLVYSAIAVYAIAFVAYAGEIAFATARQGVSSRVSRLVPAYVGGGPEPTGDPGPAGHPGPAVDVPRGERWGRSAVALTVLAVLLHACAVVARGVSAGRVPWGNMYEFSITAALAVGGLYVVLLRRAAVRYLGIIVVPAVLLTLGVAITLLYTESAPLQPVLESVWLVVHVCAAIVSSGLFTIGALLTALYLLRARGEAAGRGGGWLSRLPEAAKLDRLAYRIHAFVFPLWTFAVVSGAIWAENAWGRYWGWDAKEVWAFITWVVYAAYLHARATAAGVGAGRRSSRSSATRPSSSTTSS